MPFLPETFNWFEESLFAADWWGIVGLIVVVVLTVLSFFTFRHFRRLGNIVVRTILLAFFTFRIILMTQYVTATSDVIGILPWQLASLCFMLLPISVLLNLPRFIKTPIAFASFFVGLITLLSMAISPLTFQEFSATTIIDALISYSVLTVTPTILFATDTIHFSLKKGLPFIYLLLALLVGWGYLANIVLYPGHNIFYLETSMLPFSITPIPIIDYLIMLVPFIALFYLLMHFFQGFQDKYRVKHLARMARENVLLKENRKQLRQIRAAKRLAKKEVRQLLRAAKQDLD